MKTLEKDPKNRPDGMRALLRALDEVAIDRAWTQERAAEWWHQHLPESVPLVA